MANAQELHDRAARHEDLVTRHHITDAIDHLESSLTLPYDGAVEQLQLALESVQTARARLGIEVSS